MRDDQREGYPLPCDTVSGMAWWRINSAFCHHAAHWREWQSGKRMTRLIPVLRWLRHGAILSQGSAA